MSNFYIGHYAHSAIKQDINIGKCIIQTLKKNWTHFKNMSVSLTLTVSRNTNKAIGRLSRKLPNNISYN